MEDLADASVRLKIWTDKAYKTELRKKRMSEIHVMQSFANGLQKRMRNASESGKRRTVAHSSSADLVKDAKDVTRASVALPMSFTKSSLAPRVGEQEAVAEVSEEGMSEHSDEDRAKS